jgi:hypothetical protein
MNLWWRRKKRKICRVMSVVRDASYAKMDFTGMYDHPSCAN